MNFSNNNLQTITPKYLYKIFQEEYAKQENFIEALKRMKLLIFTSIIYIILEVCYSIDTKISIFILICITLIAIYTVRHHTKIVKERAILALKVSLSNLNIKLTEKVLYTIIEYKNNIIHFPTFKSTGFATILINIVVLVYKNRNAIYDIIKNNSQILDIILLYTLIFTSLLAIYNLMYSNIKLYIKTAQDMRFSVVMQENSDPINDD